MPSILSIFVDILDDAVSILGDVIKFYKKKISGLKAKLINICTEKWWTN